MKYASSGISKENPYSHHIRPRPIFKEMAFERISRVTYEEPLVDPDADCLFDPIELYYMPRRWVCDVAERAGIVRPEILVTAFDVYLSLREIANFDRYEPPDDITAVAHGMFDDLVQAFQTVDHRVVDWIENWMADDYQSGAEAIDHMNSIYGTEIIYTNTWGWTTEPC